MAAAHMCVVDMCIKYEPMHIAHDHTTTTQSPGAASGDLIPCKMQGGALANLAVSEIPASVKRCDMIRCSVTLPSNVWSSACRT